VPGGASALAQDYDGPHADWIQIRMIERHRTPACSHPRRSSRMILIGLGLEITQP